MRMFGHHFGSDWGAEEDAEKVRGVGSPQAAEPTFPFWHAAQSSGRADFQDGLDCFGMEGGCTIV